MLPMRYCWYWMVLQDKMLDGTAKGGVVIGISDQFKIPVKYIGLGEGIEDMQVFRKKEFVDSLFGETEK